MVLPKGIVASGFPKVRETCRQIGVLFDPWQVDLNRCILAKSADGLYAADTVGLSIARQVGKTFDIGAVVFALCIIDPGTTVVWTAHRFKVSRETFTELRGLAKSPKLAPHIDYDTITTAAGNECIPFRNGSRIVFAARERGAIRGFTKVRILILDEAQILSESALADLAPTMNQAVNPLIIMMGTPPKPGDPAEVFTNLRSDALSSVSDDVLFVEISADPGSDPNDQKAWRRANPSFPDRTPARAIRRLQKLLSEDDFRREALGIWDSDAAQSVLPGWTDCEDPDSAADDIAAFGIAVSLDRSTAAIGVAGFREDGAAHLEVIDHRRGTGWVVERCLELEAESVGCVFVVDGGGPAANLIDPLEAAGLTVEVLSARDVGTACQWLIDATAQRAAFHGPQPELDMAVSGAKLRNIGDGMSAFGRRLSSIDISPLESVMLAAHVLPSVLPLDSVTAVFL